jgi:Domain of unknown function (DUF4402)
MPSAIDPDECAKGSRAAIGLLALLAMVAAPTASTQTISSVTSLSFGSFIAGSGGTVVVSPASIRTPGGGVFGIGQGGGVAAAAQFTVMGTAGASYSISLPVDNTVELSDGNGHVMALNSFLSSPAGSGTLIGGSQTIRIGATLIVRPNQAPGSYAGAFNVTVNYP